MAGIFDKQVLVAVVESMDKPKSFLRDTFFPNEETSNVEMITIDIVKGNRKVAPFVHPVIGGKVMTDQGYVSKTYTPPLVAPEKIINIEDLQKRMPGENPYEKTSPDERQAAKASKNLSEMEDAITRREELMCSQVIFEGKIHVKGDNVDEIIDFGFGNFIELVKKWDDPTADKYQDILSLYEHVQKNGYVNAGMGVFAPDVVKMLLNDEKFMKKLDIANANLAKIDPKQLPNGATYIGTIKQIDLDIYTYNAWYTDDWTNPSAPVTKPYVPEGLFALLPNDTGFIKAYGAVGIAEDDEIYLVEGSRIPDIETKKRPARKIMSLYSRPLMIPTKIDSYGVCKVK